MIRGSDPCMQMPKSESNGMYPTGQNPTWLQTVWIVLQPSCFFPGPFAKQESCVSHRFTKHVVNQHFPSNWNCPTACYQSPVQFQKRSLTISYYHIYHHVTPYQTMSDHAKPCQTMSFIRLATPSAWPCRFGHGLGSPAPGASNKQATWQPK